MMKIKSAALAAMLLTLATLVGSATTSCDVRAQDGGCVGSCRSAYADCYRSTSNRAACESKLQSCMQGCISKRG